MDMKDTCGYGGYLWIWWILVYMEDTCVYRRILVDMEDTCGYGGYLWIWRILVDMHDLIINILNSLFLSRVRPKTV